MPRTAPSKAQSFLSSVVVPLLSLCLLPVSFTAVVICVLHGRYRRILGKDDRIVKGKAPAGVVMISGGRMTKGLTLARAFKRAGWKVIGVEEKGWGELCPMRFSSAVDHFYLLKPAASSYDDYRDSLIAIAKAHNVNLFLPVSGVASSVEDARSAEEMSLATKGKCETFIQDPETMLDLHDKDRFMALVEKLGMVIPKGKMVTSVDEAMEFLGGVKEPTYILKCMGIDENRGDMTLFPLRNGQTRKTLESLQLKISLECPYVFQEFIPGQEYCTHASVINGKITSFVVSPSNDMLMTYENVTHHDIGRRAEEWTTRFLERLQDTKSESGRTRQLTGHFSFDFILHSNNGELYPIECNARVHTAVILLPLSGIAGCYTLSEKILRPHTTTHPRSWLYNDIIMRYLPALLPSFILQMIHPSLPRSVAKPGVLPHEALLTYRVDPTLVADDWKPFLVLWHLFWPALLPQRWWNGKRWTRLNVSTGRIFEA